jgi:hypothetical protein
LRDLAGDVSEQVREVPECRPYVPKIADVWGDDTSSANVPPILISSAAAALLWKTTTIGTVENGFALRDAMHKAAYGVRLCAVAAGESRGATA